MVECAGDGGRLAVIDSEESFSSIRFMLATMGNPQDNELYLGMVNPTLTECSTPATCQGIVQYIDGSYFKDEDWMVLYEFIDIPGNEACGYITYKDYASGIYQFGITSCGTPRRAICQLDCKNCILIYTA